MMTSILSRIEYKLNKCQFYILNRKLIRKHQLEYDFSSMVLYQPVYLYQQGGRYSIGAKVQFGYDIGGRFRRGYCELQSRTKSSIIVIGNNTAISNNFLAISSKKILIGNNCRIGINCQIMDFDAHSVNPKLRSRVGKIKEVIIEDNVWIGNNVIILSGVHIGCNSIVGAGAVVTNDIPSNVICGGVPAKIINHIE